MTASWSQEAGRCRGKPSSLWGLPVEVLGLPRAGSHRGLVSVCNGQLPEGPGGSQEKVKSRASRKLPFLVCGSTGPWDPRPVT